jgi:hypothetical protein
MDTVAGWYICLNKVELKNNQFVEFKPQIVVGKLETFLGREFSISVCIYDPLLPGILT